MVGSLLMVRTQSCVAIALLLPFIERELPTSPTRSAMARGLLWGGISASGLLSKLTFAFFLVGIVPLTLLLSFRYSGLRATIVKLGVAGTICILPLVMFMEYGSLYLRIAWLSSYAGWAEFYNDNMSLGEFFRRLAVEAGIDYKYWLLNVGIVGVGLFAAGAIPVAYCSLARLAR